MGYRIYDTDGALVTESNGKAKWTHAVVADYVVETYEQELAEALVGLKAKVDSGSWTQETADRGLRYYERNLEEARSGRAHAWSTHKSYEAAVKEIEKGLNDRFTNPRIVEVEQV